MEQTRYLGGIVLKSARAFKCLLDSAKVKFYRCFNAIYYRAQNAGTELVNAGTELVCVQLVQSICLSQLLYAVCLALMKSDVARLNHVIDRDEYRIFRCSSAEDSLAILEQLWTYRALRCTWTIYVVGYLVSLCRLSCSFFLYSVLSCLSCLHFTANKDY